MLIKKNKLNKLNKLKYKKVIIFDFDGVIADSLSCALEIAQKINQKTTLNDFRKRFNGSITDVKRNKTDKYIDFDKELYKNIEKYRIKFNAISTLKKISKKHKLVIITNTSDYIVKTFLKSHNIYDLFDKILDIKVSKSKVKRFEMIFDEYNIKADNSLFVTDTLGDILEANVLNIPTVAILEGFSEYKELLKGKPLAII